MLHRKICAAIERLPLSQAWRIEICEHKARRSDQQNRYLWGVVYKAIAEKLPGWDLEDIHDFCLGEHFGWETISGLGKRRLRPIRRSSRLTKLEFMEYIGFIQRRMAQHGIVIPDPQELAA
jgi:hypothetical protein